MGKWRWMCLGKLPGHRTHGRKKFLFPSFPGQQNILILIFKFYSFVFAGVRHVLVFPQTSPFLKKLLPVCISPHFLGGFFPLATSSVFFSLLEGFTASPSVACFSSTGPVHLLAFPSCFLMSLSLGFLLNLNTKRHQQWPETMRPKKTGYLSWERRQWNHLSIWLSLC